MSRMEAQVFVNAMIEAGSDIAAIGHHSYFLADPVDLENEAAYQRIELVASSFPNRDNILSDIVACLHEIGRVVDIPTVDDDWQ